MIYRFHSACRTLRRDPLHLPLRDRAVLRILNRTQVATAEQLTALAYGHRRVAQHRLRRLWDWGLVERASLPPAATRGGAPLAYRLSSACLRRLGYHRTQWRGPGYLAHSLHAVDAVCALVGSSDRDSDRLVQLWLPESVIDSYLLDGYMPDAIVVLSTDSRSAVLCLEVDEATQHLVPVRDKLRAYRQVLQGRPGWRALFVVPTDDRLAWLRHVAATTDGPDERLWAVVRSRLEADGMEAPVSPLRPDLGVAILDDLLADPRERRSLAPVGSNRWLELLGSGGGEDPGELLE